jgi:uncharacterized zinc-type alcohol dehydrogenase-like protein
MMQAIGYATKKEGDLLSPISFTTRDLRDHDVLIKILYCGICHSDIHIARNEWQSTRYPVVPGHEIIGEVIGKGPLAKKHHIGDIVGVGCIIGSCTKCPGCKEHLEQYCDQSFTLVFNSKDPTSGCENFGGFSSHIVVEEPYALSIPTFFSQNHLAAAAPLLCAGITTFSPLKHFQIGPKSRVGVIGLGGLGHMAVKMAKALGAEVTVITSSETKSNQALKLGASNVIISSDEKLMKLHHNTFDFLLDTISHVHDLNQYIDLLQKDGTLCLVGLPQKKYQDLQADLLITKRRKIAGSLIGSIKETQDMLEFCALHQIFADVEIISPKDINKAFEEILQNKIPYRFVINMKDLG